MATMPMMQQQTPDADQATEGQEVTAPGQDDGSEEFVIKRASDGSLSVYVETGEDESAEQSAKPVDSPGEALQAALQWLKSGPSGANAEQQLQQGYASRGQLAPGGP